MTPLKHSRKRYRKCDGKCYGKCWRGVGVVFKRTPGSALGGVKDVLAWAVGGMGGWWLGAREWVQEGLKGQCKES